jgi:hypothetical protein
VAQGRRGDDGSTATQVVIHAEDGSVLMISHRRAGVVARALRLRSSKAAVTTPRRLGIELVDAHSGVKHWVSPDELLAGRARGITRRSAVGGC